MKVQNITNIEGFFSVVDSCKGKVELVTGEEEEKENGRKEAGIYHEGCSAAT